jgi:purine-nucleoside phosphorylase
MPARLRPTAPIAREAILVGDPGRALMLAQELLRQPKMSNHARGLWGYTGATAAGRGLTIQSTGMGGPSASVVLADLAELGVRRAIRIGTCTALKDLELGDLTIVTDAFPEPGAFSWRPDDQEEPRQPVVDPDAVLTHELVRTLGGRARGVVSVSLDVLHRPEHEVHPAAEVADMQTAALFATGSEFEVAMAALLVVAQTKDGRQIDDEDLKEAAKGAGRAAAAIL